MKLADVFQNGAVLQQKKPIVVWGTDDNGRYVKAVLSGEEPREARAEIKDGKFVLTFAPMQAQKEARLVLENDLGENTAGTGRRCDGIHELGVHLWKQRPSGEFGKGDWISAFGGTGRLHDGTALHGGLLRLWDWRAAKHWSGMQILSPVDTGQ